MNVALDLIDQIYKTLVANPMDWFVMNALADALEDYGNTSLALAYRWAAKHKRWPFTRTFPGHNPPSVYDWDANRPRSSYRVTVRNPPPHSHLPQRMFLALRNMKSEHKQYGDIHYAFVLLSKVLTPQDLDYDTLDLTWRPNRQDVTLPASPDLLTME